MKLATLLAVLGFGWPGTWANRALAQAAKPEPGLVVTYSAGGATDTALVPNALLYVTAGQPVSPFVPAGKFTADWSGFISADLRGDYAFLAEAGGEVKLEINGATVLDASNKAGEPGKPVRLNKGTNAFKLTCASPAQGDAFLRLRWIPKNSFPQPIPNGALSHAAAPELVAANQRRLGRELFVEFRCVKCHTGPAATSAISELAMDAPAFDAIGSQRNGDWLARWILDPHANRAAARMPRLLHGPKAKEDAEAMAAFLGSQKSDDAPAPTKEAAPEWIEAGKKLAESLHCAGCHNLPGAEPDPKKAALKHVREKFPPGALALFLKKPEAHYAWIRMPNFHLTDDEAQALTVWLNSEADAPKDAAPAGDAAVLERGKNLVQTSGCLNCHNLKLENQFTAKPLTELPADKWKSGCLAEKPDDVSKAPQFAFTAAEREALAAFGATDRVSLARHVPAEFAERQTRTLNCTACHGQLDGFPRLDILGAKLRPEWTEKFLAGQVDYKPRPWIEARMPAFASRAGLLARGLAMSDGYPPQTPPETGPLNAEEAKLGRKLVSADGGFSCVACHAVGDFGATQVFESAGVNLAYTSERLFPAYFQRWLLNPLLIEPQTKMPVYFEEGRSPLADIHDGDAAKQINTVWQYLRLGPKMPPPGETQ